jgi:predicted transcriptional regulator
MRTSCASLTAAAWPLLAFLVVVPAASALPVSSTVDFSVPAQGQGDATIEGGQWALIIFRNAAGSSLRLTLPDGATQTNYTYTVVSRLGPSDYGSFPLPVPPRTTSLGVVEGTLSFGAPWASFFVRADSIRLTAPTSTLDLTYAEANSWANEQLPPAFLPEWMLPLDTPAMMRVLESQPAVGIRSTHGTTSDVALHIGGIQNLLWHNATIECRSSSCPDSSQTWTLSTEAGGTTRLARMSYIELDTARGTLDGSGEVWIAALGGTSLGLGLQGEVRLPDTSLHGKCGSRDCPDPNGKTLLAEGNLTLQGLAVGSGPNRLRAAMTGYTSAVFDEASAWDLTVPQKIGVGLAVVGLGLLVKVLLGLFSKVSRERSERRQAILQLIENRPGVSLDELANLTGADRETVRYHVQILASLNQIVPRRGGHTMRFFENHGRFSAQAQVALTVLQDGATRQFHDYLLANPGVRRSEAIRHARLEWKWTRTATYERLERLMEAGLVVRDGRALRAKPISEIVQQRPPIPPTTEIRPRGEPA